MGELHEAGCKGISDDGKPVMRAAVMRRAMEYSTIFDIAVISHCETQARAQGVMNEGFVSRARPPGIERGRDVMTARDMSLPN